MKKNISVPALFAFLTLFLLTSCEKKDLPLNDQLIGKWEVQSIQQVNFENNVKISETTIFLKTNEYSIQFVDGGTGIQFQDGAIVGAFTWTLSGQTLRITGGTSIWDWGISINSNTLVWSYSESEVVDTITKKYEYYYTAGKVN